jgi:hypothetical protein
VRKGGRRTKGMIQGGRKEGRGREGRKGKKGEENKEEK